MVVTAAWNTASPARRRVSAACGTLRAFQLTGKLLEGAKPDAMLLHCLPAHRGEEISAAVLSSTPTRSSTEAENRLHVQKAVLAILLAGL